MTYVKKAVHGASTIFLMTLVAGLISYGTRVVVARNLGPEEYGLFTSVFTFVVFFLFFRDLGLGTALVKYIASSRAAGKFNEIKTAITSVFVLQFASSLFFSILFAALADFLARYYFKDPDAKIILMIMMIYVLLSVLFTMVKQIFNGFQENFLYSIIEPIKNLVVLLLTLLFFNLGFGVFAPALPFAFVCPIIFMIFLPKMRKLFHFSKYKIVSLKNISQELVLFGLPVMATDIGGRIIGYIDTLMLTYMRTLTEVGIYNIVLPTAVFFVLISRAISSVIFPMTSELVFKKDFAKIKTGIDLLHRYTFIIAVPIVFTLFAFSSFFIQFFFGEQYLAGALAFQILLVGVILFTVAGVNNTIIAGMGEPQSVTKIIFSAALLNVIVNLFLIQKYGINGAAFATSASYAMILLLSTRKLTKILHMKFPWRSWLKLIPPTITYIITILTVQSVLMINIWLEVIISIFLAVIAYFLMLYLFELINLKEIQYYTKIVIKQ